MYLTHYEIYICLLCCQIRFLLIVLIVVLCGWLLNKRFRIGLLALLGGGLFVFGYLHTYLECNRVRRCIEMVILNVIFLSSIFILSGVRS